MKPSAERALGKALEHVAASPERLADIIEDSPEPLIAFTPRRTIEKANVAAEVFFGYARHELDSHSVDLLVPERLRQPGAPPPVATPDLTTVELSALRKDGSEVPTVWIFGSARTPNGPVFVMVVLERQRVFEQHQALGRSDARYRSLLVASASVWIASPNGEFVEPQPGWEAYTGQSWEEHRGSKWISAIHPEDRQRVIQDWTTAVQARSDLYRTHGRLWSAKHKAWRAFQTRGVSIRNAEGEIVEWIGALTDIQDTLDAQDVVRAAERKRLLAMLEQIPAIVNVLRGPDLVFEFAHPKAVEMSKRPLHGRRALEAFAECKEQEAFARLQRVYETGEANVLHESPMTMLVDGQSVTRYWDSVHAPIRDDAGRIDSVMTFDLDVTEKVLARQKLEIAERRYRALVDADIIGVVVATEAGITEANDAFLRIVGRSREDLEAGRIDWRAITPPEFIANDEAALVALRTIGKCHPFEKAYIRPDGSRVPILIGAARLLQDPFRWISYVLDLTERKRVQSELEAANQRLLVADRAKDEFLATMSHELRTPLHAILGWSTMLKVTPRDPKKVERGLEVIERNARAQERLVGDLLDVSRIVSGKLRLRLRRTDLSSVIHAAADVVRPVADNKGVRLVLEIDPEIGATVADPDRVQQMLWNLLTNAVRFTARGGHVSVVAERSSSRARIQVTDTGEGIAPEHLPYLFDRFRQVDSSITRSHTGLGLGLTIVRHLVEAHGGQVQASSEGRGRGATFIITLPIRAVDTFANATGAEESAPPGSEESEKATAVRMALEGARILLVEDDPDSLELVTTVLESAGAQVTGYRIPREALAARGPFDVIISDVGMPGMDGYAFMRQVRARDVGGDIPALALTAYSRSDDEAHAVRSGYQEHLAKPVDARQLIEAVGRWVKLPR